MMKSNRNKSEIAEPKFSEIKMKIKQHEYVERNTLSPDNKSSLRDSEMDILQKSSLDGDYDFLQKSNQGHGDKTGPKPFEGAKLKLKEGEGI